MNQPNEKWAIEILSLLSKLEADGSYGQVVIQVEAGDVVRVRLERSAKTVEELARFG